jgi:AGZA family xanthine/uracil permease-like MFS transporter
MSVSASLDSFFKITERGSTIATEVRAGVASFLTISYVILVNPQILSQCGIPSRDVVIGTCLASAVGTILTGVVGNLPFGLAPGMGLSA